MGGVHLCCGLSIWVKRVLFCNNKGIEFLICLKIYQELKKGKKICVLKMVHKTDRCCFLAVHLSINQWVKT